MSQGINALNFSERVNEGITENYFVEVNEDVKFINSPNIWGYLQSDGRQGNLKEKETETSNELELNQNIQNLALKDDFLNF